MSLDRIIEEFKDINRNPISNCGVTVGLKNDNNYKEWKVSLLGPRDTSYRGGLFFLSIKFPDNYPDKQPEVCFLTPIYRERIFKCPEVGYGLARPGKIAGSYLIKKNK